MTTSEHVDVEAMRRGLAFYHDVSLRGRIRGLPHPYDQFGPEVEGCLHCEQKRTDPAPDYDPGRHKYPIPNPALWKDGSDPWRDDPELARLRAAIDARYAALFVMPDGSLLPLDDCYPPDDNWADGSVGFCDPCRLESDEIERYWADAVLSRLWMQAAYRLQYLLGMSDYELKRIEFNCQSREEAIELAHSGETLAQSWAREKRERARSRRPR